jgi:hypothetical protein
MPGIGQHEFDHELDVDFEVMEDPEDLVFPRLPNVVSHRGHRVKITAIVRDLPEPDTETKIMFRVTVNVLNSSIIGEKGHISHPFAVWGEKEVEVTFPSDQLSRLPFKVEILVPMELEDEHLGQGPDYQALIDVTTNNARLDALREAGDESQQRDGAAAERTNGGPKAEGSFLIRFASQ